MLTEWLRSQDKRGALVVPDAAAAAGMLISMVIADPQMCVLIGESRAPEDAVIDERVERAVGLFLQGSLPRRERQTPERAPRLLPVAAN